MRFSLLGEFYCHERENIIKKRRNTAMMSFSPLWKTMKQKNVSCYTLINKHGISRSLLDKLKHNRNVTLSTVERLCKILDCRVEDIVEYREDEE